MSSLGLLVSRSDEGSVGGSWREGNWRWGGWPSNGLGGGRTGEVGYNVSGLGVWLRARLRGMERVSLRGIGFEDDWVGGIRIEGGCRDECRVDGVRTDRIGEGVAVVWDGVEA